MNRAALTLLLPLVLLAGCSSASAPTPSPSATSQPSVAAEDDMAACAELKDLMLPVQDVVTKIVADGSGSDQDPEEISRLASELREWMEITSPKMDTYAAPFASVVLVLDDIYSGKIGGAQTLDTGAYRDAAIGILTYCVDEVGYRAGG